MGNIFYFYSLNDIGGCETFFYYMAKKYGKYDMTIYYSDPNSSKAQIRRLRKLVRVKQHKGEIIECDKAFWNYKPAIIDKVNAKEHIGIIHANFMKQPELWETLKQYRGKINKYVAVSKDAAEAFTQRTGLECEYAYIPILPDFNRKMLIITAAQRMDSMKGANRIIELEKELNRQKVPHLILIFTNKFDSYLGANVIFLPSRLNIVDYIKGSDFFFCGSDYESYGISKTEALSVGVPVIRTPLKVDEELGIDDSNSIALNFSCDNVEDVVNQMLHKKFNFKYTPVEDKWEEYLSKEESTYTPDKFLVRAKVSYTDTREGHKDHGDIFYVDEERLEYLEGINYVEEVY
jgi:glycosyltransferase involved in cell wall biosynthesis